LLGDVLTDTRRGKNGRHDLVGQFRQSVFGRLGGYDDVYDADCLSLDPIMRWIVGGHAVTKQSASSSQMGRFETEVLASEENLAALADLSGAWIDKVHDRHPPTRIIRDMHRSVSPTHGEGNVETSAFLRQRIGYIWARRGGGARCGRCDGSVRHSA